MAGIRRNIRKNFRSITGRSFTWNLSRSLTGNSCTSYITEEVYPCMSSGNASREIHQDFFREFSVIFFRIHLWIFEKKNHVGVVLKLVCPTTANCFDKFQWFQKQAKSTGLRHCSSLRFLHTNSILMYEVAKVIAEFQGAVSSAFSLYNLKKNDWRVIQVQSI